MAQLINHDGVTIFDGEIVGGGGSAPTTREEWSGAGVALAAPHTFDWLTWDSNAGPDTILDATDPAHPVTVTPSGVYLVSVTVGGSGNESSYADISLFLDRTGFNASQIVRALTGPATTDISGMFTSVCIAFAWYLPTGAKVEVGADYFTSGGAAASLAIHSAHIQRLS